MCLPLSQLQGLWRSRMKKNPITLGTAERKILLVFLYYIILGVFCLTTFTLAAKHYNRNTVATIRYFECEKNGRNNTCSYDAQQYPVVVLMTHVLFSLFPTINLVFAINVQEIKALVKQLRKLFKQIPLSMTEDKTESIAVSTLSGK